jgi:hypothetical protein
MPVSGGMHLANRLATHTDAQEIKDESPIFQWLSPAS